MKKITSILLSLVLILSFCSAAMLTVSAEEAATAPSVWDGTANIKWYIDGKAKGMGEYELNSAADLAGLAYIVNASQSTACYTGVYYDANYKVLGYRLGSSGAAYADMSLVYTPTAGDGSQVIDGDAFTWQNVKLCCDVVLNEGNAADWATTPPTYTWQPIGGGIAENANKWFGFDGMFDGQGHTISGMYTSSTKDANITGCGVFGIMGYQVNGGVSNLIVENFYQESARGAAGLIGRTKQAVVIENCVIRNGYVVGSKEHTGAIIGGAFNAVTITNCGVENVSVKGVDFVGGMVGTSNGYSVDVTDSYVIGSVEAGWQLGLIVGRKKEGAINLKNVYTAIEAKETATTGNYGAGVVFGFAADNSTVTVVAENYFYVNNFTLAAGEVKGTDTEGATAVTLDHLKGETAKATLTGFDFDTVWKTVENGTPVIELREAPNAGGDEGGEQGGEQGGTTTDPGDETEPETDPDDETEPTTKAPEKDTTPTDDEKDGGCGSVIGFASVAMIVLGAGVCAIRKKNN